MFNTDMELKAAKCAVRVVLDSFRRNDIRLVDLQEKGSPQCRANYNAKAYSDAIYEAIIGLSDFDFDNYISNNGGVPLLWPVIEEKNGKMITKAYRQPTKEEIREKQQTLK